MSKEEIDVETNNDWEGTWKPLLYTNGKLDIKKIEAEMKDLIFIFNQVGHVYCEITGNRLSKPMYYSDTIISEHYRTIDRAKELGAIEALEEVLKRMIENRRSKKQSMISIVEEELEALNPHKE